MELLEAFSSGQILKDTAYGYPTSCNTVEIESVITNIIESKTEYITDTSLTPGTEKVTQKGANGSTSEAYKKLIKNGVIVSRTLLSKDTYNALPTIIKRNS